MKNKFRKGDIVIVHARNNAFGSLGIIRTAYPPSPKIGNSWLCSIDFEGSKWSWMMNEKELEVIDHINKAYKQ